MRTLLVACTLLLVGVLPASAQWRSTLSRECGMCASATNCSTDITEQWDECVVPIRAAGRLEFSIPLSAVNTTVAFVLKTKAGVGLMSLSKLVGGNQVQAVNDSTTLLSSGGNVYENMMMVMNRTTPEDVGTYYLTVTAEKPENPLFGFLEVYTSHSSVMLTESDASVLRAFFKTCCSPYDWSNSLCSVATQALSAGHTWQEDLCHQPPLKCNNAGRLTRLVLPGQGLVCSSPPTMLSSLTELKALDLSGAWLSTEMKNMEKIMEPLDNLEFVSMEKARLNGSVSCTFLFNHSRLATLDLDGNDLDQKLPACLLVSNLQELFLSGNSIRGTLPDILGQSKLTALFLSGTYIAGTIPSSLSQSKLEFLALGRGPYTSGRWPRLNGTLPQLPQTMHWLNLSTWRSTDDSEPYGITGPFPNVAGLPYLFSLGLTNQLFSGPVPDLTSAPALQNIYAGGNQLTGGLPAVSDKVRILDIHDNNLDADISSWRPSGNMAVLSAAMNQLKGFPAAIAQSASLQLVELQQNQLEGTLPVEWNTPSLRMLYLYGNRLTGSLPAALGQQQQLHTLEIDDNQLSGTLEDFASGLSASNILRWVWLANNNLEGTLPAALARLALFNPNAQLFPLGSEYQFSRFFNISNNKFTGPMPASLINPLSAVSSTCGCDVTIVFGGGRNKFDCPTGLVTQPAELLRRALAYGSKCTLENGTQVALTVAVNVSTPADAAYEGSDFLTPAPPPAQGMSAGTIAGIVVGVLAGVAIIASLGYFVVYKRWVPEYRIKSFNRFDDSVEAPAIALSQTDSDAARFQPLQSGTHAV